MSVFDRIDPRSPTPLYEQIASRIRVAVAAGELGHGDSLPSVRQLATTLRINPATVVQAYRELEAQGFAERRHGAGTFVTAVSDDTKREERMQQAKRLVHELMTEAARLGVNGADLWPVLQQEFGKGPNDKRG